MLIELRYYSPTDYNIWHYGLIEALNYKDATDKLNAAHKPLRLGSEPISFRQVINPHTHDWGKGFNMKWDFSRRIV
jgi:hypothetical protein